MTWLMHHRRSEDWAAQAYMESLSGRDAEAQALFRRAAKEEHQALKALPPQKARTFAITGESAISLWLKASDVDEAYAVSLECLRNPHLSSEAKRRISKLVYPRPRDQTKESIAQSLLFSFEGRINRAKWWLINIAVLIVYAIVIGAVAASAAMSSEPQAAMETVGTIGGIVILVVTLALVWISLAVAAKRWHDRGKSAWWILIAFVPVIGGLWYLIECGFLRGTTGVNKFGPDPLASL